MKRCPTCEVTYADETLNFCLEDGTALVERSDLAEPTTQVLPEAQTRIQVNESNSSAGARTTSSKEFVLSAIRTNKLGALIAAIGLIVVVGGFGYGIVSFFRDRNTNPTPVRAETSNLKMQPVTASGNIREAAISPDGKFLAYTQAVNSQAAVWTKQISTNSNVQIAPPSPYDYFSLKFSPNGDYVYYARYEVAIGTLYRVPTLGGTPQKIATRVDGQISFSPDGSQIVFLRYTAAEADSAIMIINADGSGEHRLSARAGHQYSVGSSFAWSPDGKFIAYAVGDDTFEPQIIMAKVDVATGETTEFGKQRFDVLSFAVWSSDQSELFVLASQNGRNSERQIWTIAYPSGEARQMTQDLMDYFYLSITADSKSMVAVQRQSFGSVWHSTTGDIAKLTQISRGKNEGTWGMTMTPDGRIVYVSSISGATEVWIMNSDGSGAKQLTNDGIMKYTPTVTGDGRYIVFVSEKGGRKLWRMDLDGGQQTPITHGPDDGNPRATPDGNWVVYDSYRSGRQVLWRVSIQGGEPHQVTDFPALEADVSPDGKLVACFTTELNPENKWEIAILPFEGGNVVNKLPVPQTVAVDNSPLWTPDGKGITFIDWRDDVANVWLQPVDGSEPKQITNYKQGNVFRREWSRDGKRVAIVLGSETSDAVMLTNFR